MSDYQVNNPATGEVEATYPTATEQDIQNAIAQADTAYQDWRQVSLVNAVPYFIKLPISILNVKMSWPASLPMRWASPLHKQEVKSV